LNIIKNQNDEWRNPAHCKFGIKSENVKSIVTNHFNERVRAMNENDKQRRQLEPQIDSWNAELNKLEGKIRKAITGRKSDYDIIMAALRRPRNKTKLNLK